MIHYEKLGIFLSKPLAFVVVFIYLLQSGEPWETWNGSVYGYSSDTIRYAESAGAHTGNSHYQIDLNYTQNFKVFGDSRIQLRADIFNLTDNQSGYNIDPDIDNVGHGLPRNYYKPRYIQLALNYVF